MKDSLQIKGFLDLYRRYWIFQGVFMLSTVLWKITASYKSFCIANISTNTLLFHTIFYQLVILLQILETNVYVRPIVPVLNFNVREIICI